MTRRWDSDKALPRGDAKGTRGGRAVRLESRPPTRDTNSPPVERPRVPANALAVLRPPAWPAWLNGPWFAAAIAVGLLYGTRLHQVPWLLVLIPVGRVIRSLVVHRRHWVALTATSLEGGDGNDGWSVPTPHLESIRIARARSPRIEFLDARGRVLAHAAPVYTGRQIARLADALGVRIVD